MADYLNTGTPEQNEQQLLIERMRRLPAQYQSATTGIENALFPERATTSPYGGTDFMGAPLNRPAPPGTMTGRTAVAKPGTPGAPAAGAPAAPPLTIAQQWNQAAEGAAGTPDPRNQQLYDMLLQRAQQSLNPDFTTGALKTAADQYSAGAERARRSYLADAAESMGPGANMLGEARLSAEKMGQDVGRYRSTLAINEIAAKRQEIAQALSGAAGLLSQDQQAGLQRELARMDFMLKERELNITEADRKAHYDALKRGLYKE